MPRTRPGTFRVNIVMPGDADKAASMATATDAAVKHTAGVSRDKLTVHAWFQAGESTEGLTMGEPAAKTRWTKDGNLSVEVC